MEVVWFSIIATMLAVYVALDGFDFGAGILHLFVARTDPERRTVLAAIGPVWDGNEVWLLASGGVLVYSFPRAYSAGFSGFYLPLMMALWLLILRGLSIEFRSHEPNPLWRSFWDGAFTLSSVLMAVILGAALGNVIRGVPLDASGFFAGPLFTDFRPGPHPGVLDWYTVLVGVFALVALAAHAALYLVWKTSGPVQERSRALAAPLWGVVLVLGLIATLATAQVQPRLYANLLARPWTWLLLILIAGSLAMVFVSLRGRRELPAFLASTGFLISMLAATAAGLFPNILVSTLDPAFNLNVYNAAAGALSMRIGLAWWSVAIVLAIGYFTYLFRSFRGKVTPEGEGHRY
jgi:cytochrome bd ubiquinol oxidase subunit II